MKLEMRFGALSAVAAALMIPAGERLAHAKAHDFGSQVEWVEAIVTHVDTSDNAADADYNITIRPVSPEKSAAFWSHFWRPDTCSITNHWIEDILLDSDDVDINNLLEKKKHLLSQQCWTGGQDYTHHIWSGSHE